MTDKELDSTIRSALTSDEVPPALNALLLKKAQKKKSKAKIYSFTRYASAIAAVFICAVAILSFYNSNQGEGMKSGIINDASKKTALPDAPLNKDLGSDFVDSVDSATAPDAASARTVTPAEEAASPVAETAKDASAENAPVEGRAFSLKRTAQTLQELFNDGYDYKSIINEKIRNQIASLPNCPEYKFSGISESTGFTLNDNGELTIIFSSGEIISEEHGEQYFSVGIVANGTLN